jgi:hypothetical protein
LQGGVRQQAQGDVPVPGFPPAHLILIKPHLTFRPLETFLDIPTLGYYSRHDG